MGLPPAQSSALSVLVFAGPKTMSELAAIEQVQPPTMTRIVEALVQSGRVRRKTDAVDRRKLLIEATPTGVKLLHEGQLRRVRVLTEFLSALSDEECAIVESAVTLLEAQD
jgi:DNA-binding MarR family transcriptional regulator